jgi:hypothetical protein
MGHVAPNKISNSILRLQLSFIKDSWLFSYVIFDGFTTFDKHLKHIYIYIYIYIYMYVKRILS